MCRVLLPVAGDEVLQLQQPLLTVLHHLLRVQVLHQARQNPEGTKNKTGVSGTSEKAQQPNKNNLDTDPPLPKSLLVIQRLLKN